MLIHRQIFVVLLTYSVTLFHSFISFYFVDAWLKQRRRLISHANAKSKSEKFPPPHQDGALGVPLGASHHIDPAFVPTDIPFSSTSFTYPKEPVPNWSGPLVDPVAVGASRRKKHDGRDARESSKSFSGKKDKNSNHRVKGKESVA